MKKEDLKIAVIGLGYVGLPLAIAFARSGAVVTGIDTDPVKTAMLNAGESYISHIPREEIRTARAGGHFRASVDFVDVGPCDAILICVPTPLTINRMPDLSFVEATARELARHVRPGQLVVLESTTYPGTTEDVVRPIIEAGSNLVAGKEFNLAYSPEREDPGNPLGLGEIPKVIGGLTSECVERARIVYEMICKQLVPVSSCRTAEATKLLENIFRSVNIALVNELKVIYAAMGVDIWEVIAAASTKPFGFMPFFPGPGLGGHCIPIDPFYLTWKAMEYGMRTRLIELAGEINTAMPQFVVSRVMDALNDSGLALKGARVLILGLAYKPNVDDDRESPTYEIMKCLDGRGAIVSYNDPYIPVIRAGRSHHAVAGRESQPVSAEYDVIVLCTHHREYASVDFRAMGVPLVDCRNASTMRPVRYYPA